MKMTKWTLCAGWIVWMGTAPIGWGCINPPPTIGEVRPTLRYPFALSGEIPQEIRDEYLKFLLTDRDFLHPQKCTIFLSKAYGGLSNAMVGRVEVLLPQLSYLVKTDPSYRPIAEKMMGAITKAWTLTGNTPVAALGTPEVFEENVSALYGLLDIFVKEHKEISALRGVRRVSLQMMEYIEQLYMVEAVKRFHRPGDETTLAPEEGAKS
ncbi:MAG: hypothetical protein C0514_03765 [Candidatus Puniceispirillum sp.]|nr:hypothetical protein [Candidatus Puniceispirillum sp.]